MNLPINPKFLTGTDINDLSEHGLVLIIPISKSKNFPLVEKLSGLMSSQRCSVNGTDVIVCVADLSSPRECDLSMEIINIANGWKGFSVVARRNILSSFSYYQVIPCIIEAFQCDNRNAHCHTRVNNASFLRTYALQPLSMVNREGLEAVLPCKLASYGFYDPMIDATLVEQYQAHAVSRGVHWCPNFDASLIKIIDSKEFIGGNSPTEIEYKKPT
ncbi:TPA: hypothetical protein ACOMZA_003847 [Escherichia coli]|uniref:hypothetical protein n=1 Tax=Escherichia coli TaxID=562 RepID=UPI003B60BBE1